MTVAADDAGRGVRMADLVAGVSMAGLLLPEAVAYSGIAGMPPQAGVLCLFAGLLVYGLVGKSRFAIVSATSSSAAVMGAATLAIAGSDAVLRAALAAGLVLATGLAFLIAGTARLGSICNFISKPVLRGFSFGLAISIVIKQLPHLTGTHPRAVDLATFTWELVEALPHWNAPGVAIGVTALLALKLLARWRKLPGALLVIAGGIAIGEWLHVQARGVDLVGPITFALGAPTWPDLTRAQWLNLSELALAMLMLLFAESYGAIRSMALKHGDTVAPKSRPARLRRCEPDVRTVPWHARGRRLLGDIGQRGGRCRERQIGLDRGRGRALVGGLVLAADRIDTRAGLGRSGRPRGLSYLDARRVPALLRMAPATASWWSPPRSRCCSWAC